MEEKAVFWVNSHGFQGPGSCFFIGRAGGSGRDSKSGLVHHSNQDFTRKRGKGQTEYPGGVVIRVYQAVLRAGSGSSSWGRVRKSGKPSFLVLKSDSPGDYDYIALGLWSDWLHRQDSPYRGRIPFSWPPPRIEGLYRLFKVEQADSPGTL